MSNDLDGDGLPDDVDLDDDGDGVQDDLDAFPEDASEWADVDNDGYGDNIDDDVGNDGILDSSSGDTDPTNDGVLGSSDPTGKVSAAGFFLLYSTEDGAPNPWDTFDEDRNYLQQTIPIVINAEDVNDLSQLNGHIVNFKTEWGAFVGETGDACTLVNGQCSVQWRSGNPQTAPSDCRVAFTAWTEGEENFSDTNGNQLLDAGEAFNDMEEPFLDIDGNGEFDSDVVTDDLIVEIIDIKNFTGDTPDTGNGMHDAADGFYNGSLCAAANAANCQNLSTTIHTRFNLLIQEPFADVNDIDSDGNFDEKVNLCN